MNERGDIDVVALILRTQEQFGSRVAIRELSSERSESPATNVMLREITYRDLVRSAYALAAGLVDRGLPRGTRVAVLLDNSIELVVTEWACLVSGFVWVALNTRTSSSEIERILGDCTPGVLVYGTRYADLVDRAKSSDGNFRVPVGAAETAWRELLRCGEVALERGLKITSPAPDEPVRIRYTSGTAGVPKGAVLPRRCYDASVGAVIEVIGPLAESDVLVHVAPMTHASGAMFLPHATVGACAVVLPHFDATTLFDVLATEHATALFVVPTMLVRLVEAMAVPRPHLESLRTIVYGGASISTDRLVRAVDLFGPILVQIYGLTESTWPVTALSREEHLRRTGETEECWLARLHSCGRPTSVGALRVVTPDGRDAAAREVGEIRLRGRNTMSGYWRTTTAATAVDAKGLDADGWMHTGDLGFRDEHGYVTIVDRLHDMIVSGGFNVYPREVENALSSHPAVLEAAVVGRPDVEWGEAVHAAVVLRSGTSVTPDDLIAHCAALLAGYKKPRSLEIVAELPRNSAGKTLRRAVRAGLALNEKGRTR